MICSQASNCVFLIFSEVKFVVVEFPDENDSLFVVPESWIVPSNDDGQGVCLWPKDGDTGTITKSAKAAKPPEAGWLSFRANVKYRSSKFFILFFKNYSGICSNKTCLTNLTIFQDPIKRRWTN